MCEKCLQNFTNPETDDLRLEGMCHDKILNV